jgi:hypothetical protein
MTTRELPTRALWRQNPDLSWTESPVLMTDEITVRVAAEGEGARLVIFRARLRNWVETPIDTKTASRLAVAFFRATARRRSS